MEQAGFRFEDDLERRIEHRLLPGENKSIWFRYATETTIAVDTLLNEIYELYQYDGRQKLVEAAVKKIKRRKDEVDNGTKRE